MYLSMRDHKIKGARLEWVSSLKVCDKVQCFINTGKGGSGELMTVHAVWEDDRFESGWGVEMFEYTKGTAAVDSFWVEPVQEN